MKQQSRVGYASSSNLFISLHIILHYNIFCEIVRSLSCKAQRTDIPAGVVGAAPRHPRAHRRTLHLHQRRTVRGAPRGWEQRMASQAEVGAALRRRSATESCCVHEGTKFKLTRCIVL